MLVQSRPNLPVSCYADAHGGTDGSGAACAAGFCASLSSPGCCVKPSLLDSWAEIATIWSDHVLLL